MAANISKGVSSYTPVSSVTPKVIVLEYRDYVESIIAGVQ